MVKQAKNSTFVVCDCGVYRDPTTCQFEAYRSRKDEGGNDSELSRRSVDTHSEILRNSKKRKEAGNSTKLFVHETVIM